MDIYAQALNRCHPELRHYLDPPTILPYLSATQLLSSIDLEDIQNIAKTRTNQIDKIKSVLPTKGKGWWEKFVNCLKRSSQDPTNPYNPHNDLLGVLEKTLQELQQDAYGTDYQQPTSDREDNQPPNKPQISEKELKDKYKARFEKSIITNEKIDDLNNEQLCVLIQTVNTNEFYAVMMQLKEGSTVSQYIVNDPLCDSVSFYYVGKWGDDGEIPVAIIQTGMGSNGVFGSWYETKKAFKNLPHLKYIFAVGVCGGVKRRVKLGDVIVSEAICGYPDLKMTGVNWINRSFGSKMTEQNFYRFLTQAANIPANTKHGTVLSGPWLIKDIDIQQELLLKVCPDALAFEMEGVGIVQACVGKQMEYLIVKGVCDFGDASKNDLWQPQAAVNAAKCLCEAMTKAPPSMFKCGSGAQN